MLHQNIETIFIVRTCRTHAKECFIKIFFKLVSQSNCYLLNINATCILVTVGAKTQGTMWWCCIHFNLYFTTWGCWPIYKTEQIMNPFQILIHLLPIILIHKNLIKHWGVMFLNCKIKWKKVVHKLTPLLCVTQFTNLQVIGFGSPIKPPSDGFSGLVVSTLASGTRVHRFKPGWSRWIFQASEKSSACLPLEGKWKNLSHVPALRHVKEPSTSVNYNVLAKFLV